MNTTLRAYLVEDSLAATHHLARLLKEAGRVDAFRKLRRMSRLSPGGMGRSKQSRGSIDVRRQR